MLKRWLVVCAIVLCACGPEFAPIIEVTEFPDSTGFQVLGGTWENDPMQILGTIWPHFSDDHFGSTDIGTLSRPEERDPDSESWCESARGYGCGTTTGPVLWYESYFESEAQLEASMSGVFGLSLMGEEVLSVTIIKNSGAKADGPSFDAAIDAWLAANPGELAYWSGQGATELAFVDGFNHFTLTEQRFQLDEHGAEVQGAAFFDIDGKYYAERSSKSVSGYIETSVKYRSIDGRRGANREGAALFRIEAR